MTEYQEPVNVACVVLKNKSKICKGPRTIMLLKVYVGCGICKRPNKPEN